MRKLWERKCSFKYAEMLKNSLQSQMLSIFICSLPLLLSLLSQDGLAHFSDIEGIVRRSRQTWGANRQDRKLQRFRAQRLASHLQGDTASESESQTSSERTSQSSLTERLGSYKAVISQVPLRVRNLETKVTLQIYCQ